MTSTDPSESFIANVNASWRHVSHGDAAAANAEIKKNEELAKQLAKDGKLVEVMAPLLRHEQPCVREAAAAYLLGNGQLREEAIAELRRLVADDETLVSASAAAVLRAHRIGAV